MAEGGRPRGGLYILLLLVLLAVAAALWLPGWWENREYRQAEALTGVGSPVLAGTLTDARKKIDSGNSAEAVTVALGRPSFSAGTEGSSRHDKWIYYYADGTLTLNLTDGVVVRIAMEYGPPRIPTSRRSR